MGSGNLLKFEKRRIVLSVGDEGAVLTCVDGGKLVHRMFTASPSSPDFREYLTSNPSIPVYILVDVVDQAYIQHTLPPVSPLNVSKLVKRKLDKDFDENDITSAISMGRDKTGRKDWHYMFVSVRNIPPFSDWVEAVADLPNKFMGIFLLPMESINLLKDLRKISDNSSKSDDADWKIIVSHNRVGGFRQMVFKDNRVIFTRIAQPIGGQTPDVVAGNIEQETLNTIEYIRRLGFEDEDGLDIYIITSAEVKNVLEVSSLTSTSPVVMTPGEISTKLGYEGIAEEKDRFGDVVIAAHFANQKKHVLKLHTPYTRKIDLFGKVSVGAKTLATLGASFLIFSSIQSFLNTFDLEEKVERAKRATTEAEAQLREVESFKEEFEQDPDRIKDIAYIDNLLNKDNLGLLDIVSEYSKVHGFKVLVKSVNLTKSQQKDQPEQIKASLKIDFFDLHEFSQDQLLDTVDAFKKDVTSALEDYVVTFDGGAGDRATRLALSAGEEVKDELKLTINISGPKEDQG